jgi:succinyl-diaminopimelate desuccinylase
MSTDPVELTAALVRCPSVTPEEGGALQLLDRMLTEAGFACTRVDRNSTPNLFARWGPRNARRVLGFNGHTDVVPVGDPADWTHLPFSAHFEDGWLYGRGATDMKSGVAAFVAAAIDLVAEAPPDGAIVIAITGDEEGPGRDGTIAILDWMAETGEHMDVCIVGEPTSRTDIGDMIKIGRRGSMTAHFEVVGKQGHSAYLHKALNPMPAIAELAHRLSTHVLDEGTDHFDTSTISVTTIDTGNPASNVIPARSRMTVNIRFNDLHTGAGLGDWLRAEAERVAQSSGTHQGADPRLDRRPSRPTSKRDIAKAFGIKGAARIDLKRILRSWRTKATWRSARRPTAIPTSCRRSACCRCCPQTRRRPLREAAGMAWRGPSRASSSSARATRPGHGRGRPHPRPPAGGQGEDHQYTRRG